MPNADAGADAVWSQGRERDLRLTKSSSIEIDDIDIDELQIDTKVGRMLSLHEAARPSLAVLAMSSGLLLGCSSPSPAGGAAPGTPMGHDANPEGVPYPAQHIGTRPRGLTPAGAPDTTPGNVVSNYKFLGYPGGDRSRGLETVALADYFDPSATKYKVIHVMAAATWCGPCNDETDSLVSALGDPSTDPRARGVVYVQALVEGPSPNYGATQSDLDAWIDAHHTPFTEVLDPEAQALGAFFDASSVPFNADVDARSMEILQTGTGYEAPDAVDVWLDFVAHSPPAYAP
jgi:hypothetical protein